jgi:rubrerythrin
MGGSSFCPSPVKYAMAARRAEANMNTYYRQGGDLWPLRPWECQGCGATCIANECDYCGGPKP